MIWLLVVLFLNAAGEPVIGVEAFNSQAACEKAIPEATADVIAHNVSDASITCTPHQLGKLS